MNNFRQATCSDMPDSEFGDDTYAFLPASPSWGGSGQCCNFCAADPLCAAWTYKPVNGTCHLKATGLRRVPFAGGVSGNDWGLGPLLRLTYGTCGLWSPSFVCRSPGFN